MPIWSASTSTPAPTSRTSSAASSAGSPTPGAPPTPTGWPPTRWPARSSRPPGCPAASRSRTAARRTSTRPRSASRGCRRRVDFGAPDGPADLAFLIAAPEAGGAEHMKLLSSLARALVRKEFAAVAARRPPRRDEVVALVDERAQPAPRRRRRPAAAETPAADEAEDARRGHRVPDRHRAHLHGRRLAGRRRQGGGRRRCTSRRRARRAARRCPRTTIAGADAVIFATDVGVQDQQRFAGKPVVASGVKRAINEPAKMIAEALAAADDPNAARVEGAGAGAAAERRARRRCRLGHPDPADPADRRELHDPVRRRGRSADRARLPVRRLRDRQHARRRGESAGLRHRTRSATTLAVTNTLPTCPAGFDPVPRRGAVHPRRSWRSGSWSRRWPATSPSRSPTGPASHPASPRVRSRCSSAAASSAASSAA